MKILQSDFVTNTTGDGQDFGIYAPDGTLSYGFWIGITTVDGVHPLTSPRYWTDQPNVYLKSGDYGYVRTKFPWAHAPDKNPLWAIVFHINNYNF